MNFVWQRAYAIAVKESSHILRDPFTLALAICLPVFMVFAFGYSIEFNVKNIALAVYDADKTESSRQLIETFSSSGYFIVKNTNSPEEAENSTASEQSRASLLISSGFQKDLFSSRHPSVQLLLDGSDNATVAPVLSYLSSIQSIAAKRLANYDPKPLVNIRTRFLFNPELNSRWFVIPGLIVVVMGILSILLTALTVAREWENGSMELLLTTPVEPIEIIIGKLFPYAIMGFIAVAFIHIIARCLFGIPFQGNLWVFGLGCGLFLATYLSQGLLISVITKEQRIAMQLAMLSGLLPAQLLSGFIFPIESMPAFFQYFTMLLPARWFMTIVRESYLKGSSLLDMWIPFLSLGIMASVMIFLACWHFKKDLEP